MKAEQEIVKDGIANQDVPTTFVNINTVPVEAEVPCRTASALAFIGPNGIFTGVDKSSMTLNIRGVITEIIKFNLALNPAHRIKPGATVPNCNNDGVLYLAAQSINVAGVAEPQYIRDSYNTVTNVLVFFTRTNRAQQATLGLRVKFEENVGTTAQFNPKRKSGTITFP